MARVFYTELTHMYDYEVNCAGVTAQL